MTFTRWPLPPEDVYDRCLVISCGAAVGGWDDAAPGGDFRLFRRRQVELAGRAGESRPCGRGGAGAPYRRRGARIWGVGSAVDRPGGFRGTSDKSGHRRLGRGLARARGRVFRPWANRRGGGARTRDRATKPSSRGRLSLFPDGVLRAPLARNLRQGRGSQTRLGRSSGGMPAAGTRIRRARLHRQGPAKDWSRRERADYVLAALRHGQEDNFRPNVAG